MAIGPGGGASQQKIAAPVSRLRLVLADDNTRFVDHTIELLMKRGDMECDVVGIAADGLNTIDLVKRLAPDVVVMDISMPRLDGLEVARRLRAERFQTPIIYLTVHEDTDFLREALAVGAMGYVVKSRVVSDLPQALLDVTAGDRFVSPTPNLRLSAGEDAEDSEWA
jgi:DNA-binding NarL/FixJ family response regulator